MDARTDPAATGTDLTRRAVVKLGAAFAALAAGAATASAATAREREPGDDHGGHGRGKDDHGRHRGKHHGRHHR